MKLSENPRRPGHVLPMRPDLPCTTPGDRFCPRCGTCTCAEWSTDQGCPLHGRDNAHAEPLPLRLVLRPVVDNDALTAA